MKKVFTISFIILFVVLLAGNFQKLETINQNDFRSEEVTVIIKFDTGVFSLETFKHTTEDIFSGPVRCVFDEFGVKSMEAVFRNRYDDEGRIKPETLGLCNPHYMEGWQTTTLSKDVVDNFINQLKQLDEVNDVFIETPITIKAAIVPNDPNYAGGGQWHLNSPSFPNADIRAEQAWDINRGRNDVIIAILDGGVDYNHPDLDPGNRSRVIAGIDVGDRDNDPLDDLPSNSQESYAGHGTSIAGVVGAITNNNSKVAGVMWNCQIMPVKMVRSRGGLIPHILNWDWSTTAFPSDVADAIDYAVNNGASVINLSYSFPNMGWPINEVVSRVPHIVQAIDNAYKNNVVITASMGNEFEKDNGTRYPAGFSEQVIAVGATTYNGTRANFSNTGPHISVSAPGVGIVTTEKGGGIKSVSGTSFSAPLTAGVAGLVISQGKDRNFNLTNDDVRHIIEITANDIGATGFDNDTGYGIVNAQNALQLIDEPNVLYHYSSIGGTQTLARNFSKWIILDGRWGLPAGTYLNVDQYKITKHVTFDVPFCSPPTVWMRERESKSLNFGNPNNGAPDAFIKNVTATGFDLEYATYYVRSNALGQAINKWVPAAPAYTNVAYTTVGVPNPAAAAGSIIGISSVCSTANYSLQNPPSGARVIWSSSTPNGLSIDSITGVATRMNNFNGKVTITATVNSGCGNVNITKDVWVGKPLANINTLLWTGTRGVNPVVISPGATYAFNVDQVPNASSYTWILPTGFSVETSSNTTASTRIYITTPVTSGTYTLHCKANNICGSSWTNSLTINVNRSGGRNPMPLAVYPNPASSNLIVEKSTNPEPMNSEGLTALSKDHLEDFDVQLFDGSGLMRRSGQSKGGKLELITTGLPEGFYILRIKTQSSIEHKHIRIEH